MQNAIIKVEDSHTQRIRSVSLPVLSLVVFKPLQWFVRPVSWLKPPPGFVKLSSDGSSIPGSSGG